MQNFFSNISSYIYPQNYNNEVLHVDNTIPVSEENELITVRLNTLEDTINRFEELEFFGKWEGRIASKDLDNLNIQIKTFYPELSEKIAKIMLQYQNLNNKCMSLNLTRENNSIALPHEIQKQIFSFCSVPTIGALSIVSKRICRLANDEFVVWKKCCLNIPLKLDLINGRSFKQFYNEETSLDPFRGGSMYFVELCSTSEPRKMLITSVNDRCTVFHLKKILKKDYDLPYNLDKMRLIFCGKVPEADVLVNPLQADRFHLVIDKS